ncbi:hypothetical protein F5Y13DRAFT_205598 [Hypoxylon sp. FL1857]|nr:hypothetical protein F5Y13DRAFT_205598 [Hypoxylon sp. FL1857]
MVMSSLPILHGQYEPVAIVGMGCRCPGGVRDPPGLWRLLKDKREGWREYGEPRFSAKGFYHPSQTRRGTIRQRGGFLVDEDSRLFDHTFFGITGLEVETMDPSQRKILEVTYEAFESAGETWNSISGSRTGVFIGNFSLDHLLIQARDWEHPRPYAATGADNSILANRISYIFNIRGPSLVANTSCSSSMYALHLAVSAIRAGDCDGAIVAAANWIADPSFQFVLDKLGALSPTSRSRTFDAAADGYARGECYTALYLKKSSIALLRGLPIRAMIRGTAVNANGRTGGISRPSAAGQEDVIRKAYENAGQLPFSDTAFLECHGTGTQVGDQIEVAAVGNVFAPSRSDRPEDRLLIGAVKPNLGHTEGASAIVSIMKVVLSLEAGEIPPTYGVENLNPDIDFDKAKVEVVRNTAIPWPEPKLRRASINSFGFGGANGHCIVDHVNVVLPGYVKPGIMRSLSGSARATNGAPNGNSDGGVNGISNADYPALPPPMHSPIIDEPKKIGKEDAAARQLVLLPFSAHSISSLKLNMNALSKLINQRPLADIAYTLSCKRSRLQQRSFYIVNKDSVGEGPVVEGPVLVSPIETANVAYVFTGQGAQWHAMGAQLFEYGVFKATIAYLDYVLAKLPAWRTSWTIADILLGKCGLDHIQLSEISQVACTAFQIGLVDLLASWSIRPVAVAGHSSGEMAAAYASGYITAAEAITTAYLRGQVVSRNKKKGAMLAVGLGTSDVSKYIINWGSHVQIAAMNSPISVTLSGDVQAIEEVSVELEKDGIFNRLLHTGGNAYHSHHMAALGNDYVDMLSNGVEYIKDIGLIDEAKRYPLVQWISSVKPHKALTRRDVTAGYWRANLESPVRFTDAITEMMSLGNDATVDVLVEIGPHPALKSPLGQILKSIGSRTKFRYVSSSKRNEDGRESILRLAGTLFGLNARIDLAAVNAADGGSHRGDWHLVHGCTVVDLPPYQYAYGPVRYYESRASKESRLRSAIPHDLIGSEVPGVSKLQPQWRNVLRVKDLPWLADHRLLSDIAFPAAGFLAMAIEAATRVHHGGLNPVPITGYSLREVNIEHPLSVPEDDYGVEIVLGMELGDDPKAQVPTWASFTVSSVKRGSNQWTRHCNGMVKVDISRTAQTGGSDTEIDATCLDMTLWYEKSSEVGLGYGATFRPLSEVRVDPNQHLATANVALNATAGTVEEESNYPLHPTAMTATFQLGLVACFGGQLEPAYTAFLPIHLGRAYLKAGFHADQCAAIARGRTQGPRDAYVQSQMIDQGGNVVFEVDALHCVRFDGPKSTANVRSRKVFSSPFTRLAWKPDIRTLNNAQARALFPPPPENEKRAASLEIIDSICSLVVVDVYYLFVRDGNGPQPKGELSHWISWVKRCVEEDRRASVVEARQLTPSQRLELLQKLYQKAGDEPEAKAAERLHENMGDILNENKLGIDVLVAGGLLKSLYERGHFIGGSYSQLSNVMDCLGHANPNLRILEVGAGTGAATRVTMETLVGPNSIKRYAEYTFTDISAGFLTSAQQGFMSGYQDVKFSILDIEQDPLENGYEPVYDVVLACEAIHATTNMSRTLKNCRKLLKPGGKLILVETTRPRVLLGLLYGTLTGYWRGVSDSRTEGPFMDEQSWDLRLRDSGFSGVELALDDYNPPSTTTSVLMSTALENHGTESETNSTGRGVAPVVHLLHAGEGAPPSLLTEVAAEFDRRGVASKLTTLAEVSESVTLNARVVAFLSSQCDIFNADEGRLRSFQHLSRVAKSMVWLTSSGIVKGRDPRGAFMIGLLRAIAAEKPEGRFLSIDIDAENFQLLEGSDLSQNIVVHELALQTGTSRELGKDYEFSWQDGCMWVSRIVPDVGLSEYAEITDTGVGRNTQILPVIDQKPIYAMLETVGDYSSLHFRPNIELLQPLPAGHIDVKVSVLGLNGRGTGVTPDWFGVDKSFLRDYTGVITATSTDVIGLSVGDRVYGVGFGRLSNYMRVPAAFAQKLQHTDDLVEATTIPCAYMSAVYILNHVARLRSGHRVLILSASGALGLAAMRLALSKTEEVFAVVGTDEEACSLANDMGIPTNHIFLENSIAWTRMTNSAFKRGFDVIIRIDVNDLLYESTKALAPMGHFVNIGSVDVLNSKELSSEVFQRNVNFSSFNLNVLLNNDPGHGGQLMEEVNKLYQTGIIGPIHPFTVFDISEVDGAADGFLKHGRPEKFMVSFQGLNSLVKMIQESPRAIFNSTALYLVAGGFGRTGQAIIRWMVGRGARDFVILSRRGANTPAARILLDDLTPQGVRIEAVDCDISKREVDSIIQKVSSPNRPLRGVVHVASSFMGSPFDEFTMSQWQDGSAAPTLGTMNLHQATIPFSLDFFVMVTSTSPICASPNQSPYIAASSFQHSFARYRRRLGLPASTVALGRTSNLGSNFPCSIDGMNSTGVCDKAQTIDEHRGGISHDGLPRFPQKQDPFPSAELAMDLTTIEPGLPTDSRMWLLIRAVNDAQCKASSRDIDINGGGGVGKSPTTHLRLAFDKAIKSPLHDRIQTVAQIIAEHGVDSLIAAELRNWFQQALGVTLRAVDLLDGRVSMKSLTEKIVEEQVEIFETTKNI